MYFLLTTNSGNGDTGAIIDHCVSGSYDMELGDADLEYFHAWACQGAQYDVVFESGGFHAMHDHLHQYGGYHGSAGSETGAKLDDFAEDAFDDTISWAWLENMVSWGTYDDCPLNIIQGTSQSDAEWRRDNESYNDLTAIPDPNGQWYKYHFYCNCDPEDGEILACN